MITWLIATNNFKDTDPLSFRDKTPIRHISFPLPFSYQLKTDLFSQFYADETFSP